MWCSPPFRRRGLVSKLLDAVSVNFIYGRPLRRPEERRAFIAFSQPTESGCRLAKAWLDVQETIEGGDATERIWKVFDY